MYVTSGSTLLFINNGFASTWDNFIINYLLITESEVVTGKSQTEVIKLFIIWLTV